MPLTFKEFLLTDSADRVMRRKRRRSPDGRFLPGYFWGTDNLGDTKSTAWSTDTGSDHPSYAENEEEDDIVDISDEENQDEMDVSDEGDAGDDIDIDQPDNQQTKEPEDPDKQGAIRYVKGAKLVYKRETDEGSYEELWIYNIGSATRGEHEIRKDILAGTDIPIEKTASEDNSQSYTLWTAGNAQLLKIIGLPN